MTDWQAGERGGRRPDRRKEEAGDPVLNRYQETAAPVQTEQERQSALDRAFWMGLRQALLMAVSVIERRFDIKPSPSRET